LPLNCRACAATNIIPIVALDLESDPLAKGYVKSLAHPGGNLTGMFLDLPELGGKQIGLLKEIVPRLSRIGDPNLNVAQFAATETVARAHALERLRLTGVCPLRQTAAVKHAPCGPVLVPVDRGSEAARVRSGILRPRAPRLALASASASAAPLFTGLA